MLSTRSTLTVTNKTKQEAIDELLARTTHDADFYVLLVGAIFIAAGAIFTDSIPALIASMIIAPLATPILTLGLGLVARSGALMWRALGLLGVACLITVGLALVLTILVGNDRVVNKYISFSSNHFIAIMVAATSGAIAAYGMVKPKVTPAITGVAIAVSLMPPLVATGVGLAPGGQTTANGAFLLFLLNVASILVASACVFGIFGMGKAYRAHTN
ncbi:MAG: DUF389 domain-containing protein [Candidatus Saccharibacteria bacterium]